MLVINCLGTKPAKVPHNLLACATKMALAVRLEVLKQRTPTLGCRRNTTRAEALPTWAGAIESTILPGHWKVGGALSTNRLPGLLGLWPSSLWVCWACGLGLSLWPR